MRAMSDKQDYRRAKPLFIADVVKPDGKTNNVLNDNDKKFANVAKKALEPFYAHKYNMYFDYSRGNPTLFDLLHFHVNGEYRLTIDQSLSPPAGLRFTTTRYHDAPNRSSPQENLENGQGLDRRWNSGAGMWYTTDQITGLHGLRQGTNNDLDVGTSRFFNDLINRNDPGSLFFLPSIGTAIMSLIAYTRGWPTSLRKYFVGNQNNQSGGRIPELFDKLTNNINEDDNKKLKIGNRELARAPWFEVGDISQFDEVINSAYAGNDYPPLPQQANLFFLSWAQSIIDSPEIMELTNNIPNTLDIVRNVCQCAVRATFSTRKIGMNFDEENNMSFDTPADAELPSGYSEPSDMNIYGATDEFLRFLDATADVVGATVDPWEGKYVRLNDNTEWYDNVFTQHRRPFGANTPFDITDDVMTWLPFDGETDDEGNVSWEADGEWLIDRAEKDDTGKKTGGYFLRQSGYELLFPDDGDHTDSIPIGLGAETIYELPFSIRPTVNEGDEIKDLFLQDGDEDEEETVTVTAGDYNASLAILSRIVLDRYFEMEAYLNLVLNSTKISFNRFSKEFNDGNADYNKNLTPSNEFHTTGGKGKTQLAVFLAEQRASIMSGVYASYVALTKDTGFKKLFESELKELEVQWYTNTIAERLLAAVREESQETALAQLRAEPVPGTAEAIQLAVPRTILRRLDVPTLRLIMSEYFQSFYQEVAQMAEIHDNRPKKKGKKGKKKQLLVDKMWDTVEATLVAVMSLEGVRPHAIWSQVFSEVEQARREQGAGAPILPPSWAGSVFREELTRDPKLIGQTPNIERNATLFRNYVGFLRSAFNKDYTLIANLLTAIQTVSTRQIRDIDELRRFFEQRLKSDEKYRVKDQAVGAYRRFIYICRGILTMPAYDFALSISEDRDALLRERGSELQDAMMVQGEQAVEVPARAPQGGLITDYMPARANPSLLRPDGGV
ncbi:MAG: hypothetical protein CMD68_00770 [Gammaproteobacteria bacterium]|nr:hypothetical protein [Gammaproteobacteria bacterium]